MKFTSRIFLFLLIIPTLVFSKAQQPEPQPLSLEEELNFSLFNCNNSSPQIESESEVEMALRLGFEPEELGFLLVELDQNTSHSHNVDQLFMPASVTKVFSSLFALNTLDAQETFPVNIYYQGGRKNSELKGDLIVKSEAHPSFQLEEIEKIALAIKNSGVQKISGKFLFDDQIFQRAAYVSDDFNADDTYNAGVGGWDIRKNRIPAQVFSSSSEKQIGYYSGIDFAPLAAPVDLQVSRNFPPQDTRIMMRPRAFDDWSEEWLLNDRQVRRNLIEASGTGRRNEDPFFLENIPLKDSGKYMAFKLQKSLQALGLQTPAPERTALPKKLHFLAQYDGAPLWTAVKNILYESDNQGAELLSLHATLKRAMKPLAAPSLQDSSLALLNWLKNSHDEIEWSGFNIDRASGLTVKNWMSPRQVADFLKHYEKATYAGKSFRTEIMPSMSGFIPSVPSVEGPKTLSYTVNAKTGSLFYVRTISGYLKTANKNYVFSLFINDLERRAILDEGPSHPRFKEVNDAATDWSSRSYQLRQAIIAKWISEEP